jgi:hypothetical protein
VISRPITPRRPADVYVSDSSALRQLWRPDRQFCRGTV